MILPIISIVITNNESNRINSEKEMFCLKQGFEDFASFEDGVEYCTVGDDFVVLLKSSCIEGFTIFGKKKCDYYLFDKDVIK